MNYFDILFFSNVFFFGILYKLWIFKFIRKIFSNKFTIFYSSVFFEFIRKKNEISIKIYEVYNIYDVYFNFAEYLKFIITKFL